MRYNTLLLAACIAATSPQAVRAEACHALDDDVARALRYFVADAAGQNAGSEDKDELRWGRKVALEHGQAILPCLLAVYRDGPQKAGLSSDAEAGPAQGKWALSLIREIDATSAIALYKAQHDDAINDLGRARAAAEAAILGDSSFLDELVVFLTHPAVVPREESADLTYVQERAMAGLSVHNYQAALPVLRDLQASWPHKKLVAVYIAQLTGDVDALRRAVIEGVTAEPALLALKRMGKKDIVELIAQDPSNPARRTANAVLAGKTGP